MNEGHCHTRLYARLTSTSESINSVPKIRNSDLLPPNDIVCRDVEMIVRKAIFTLAFRQPSLQFDDHTNPLSHLCDLSWREVFRSRAKSCGRRESWCARVVIVKPFSTHQKCLAHSCIEELVVHKIYFGPKV